MVSLTPIERNVEVATQATNEGLMNGFFTLIPSTAAVYIASQNASFRARTNFQSRTAMAIMPALFMFALTSEHKLNHRMKEVASESQHSRDTVHWAEKQLQFRDGSKSGKATPQIDTELHLTRLYEQSVAESGVCIVPGDTLGLHHRIANYATENPIKVLSGMAIPAIALIFYGRSGKEHLELSSKIMHTRVFGQFATITLLLSVMGFKEYMDQNGKFITEAEARARVEEMHRIRTELMSRLQHERELQEDAKRALAEAHAEVEAAKKKKRQVS